MIDAGAAEPADEDSSSASGQARERERSSRLAPIAPPAWPAALRLTLILVALVGLVVAVAAAGAWFGLSVTVCFIAGGVAGLCTAPILARIFWSPIDQTLRAVEDGLHSCRDKDYSLRLTVTRHDEVGRLVGHYNAMADALRQDHRDVFARELLLDSLLQRAPMSILLANAGGRIVYANTRAKRSFGGVLLPGKRLESALAHLPPELREAIDRGDGGLVAAVNAEGHDEVYRVIQRDVALGTVLHRLIVIEPITQELRRQEIETWKKVLRVVCHELNNSLAPVSSLLHSARHVANVHHDMRRHDEILERVEQRVGHLARFLDGYTRFARMPLPRRERVDLSAFIDGLRGMYAFRVEGEVPDRPAWFDPGQVQQVVINLLKNAHEAGSAPDDVTISLAFTEAGDLLLSVSDRGEGMPEAMLQSAIVPFSSSKPGGAGVGLALCHEVVRGHGGRMVLRSRVGEGTTVTCVLPASSSAVAP
jgi:nitrogen fixation/metabolism regulation signal transduction histidine kinase